MMHCSTLMFLLAVFAIFCVVLEYGGQVEAAPSPQALIHYNFEQPLKRFVRQMPFPPQGMPLPPEGMPPPPEGMPPQQMPQIQETIYQSRKRREARGGGAMPTRKG